VRHVAKAVGGEPARWSRCAPLPARPQAVGAASRPAVPAVRSPRQGGSWILGGPITRSGRSRGRVRPRGGGGSCGRAASRGRSTPLRRGVANHVEACVR